MSKWVKFGDWKWPLDIVDGAQNREMRAVANFHMSLEDVLHRYYGGYKIFAPDKMKFKIVRNPFVSKSQFKD